MDTNYLTTQVTTIIGQLHSLFDEIGVPSHDRESRESELFTALSETLHNQLRLVNAEKAEMTEEAQRIIKTIKQMEASLEDSQPNDYRLDEQELKITLPLTRCLQGLKEKHNTMAKIHRERFEQVKKLVQALESYSSHLEPSFVQISLPPTSSNASIPTTFDLSPTYVTALDNEFTRVYDEYTSRIALVKATAEEIVNLWAEMGTPQAQTDSSIVNCYRDAPEQLGLHQDDIARLQSRRDRLLEEKRGRERKLKQLKTTVEELWNRLSVDEPTRKKFLAGNRGCGLRAINEFEAELDRLNELKRQNLHLFVEDARYKLQELWDGLYYSEEEMLEFTPAFSDVYSDALLSAHEDEIARLEALKEQRAPTLQLIEKHRSLIKDRDDLAASSQDASRLMAKGTKGEKRDPTRLLREEKMRKRIAKDLPKIEIQLKKTLENWEEEYGRPFLVHGERYFDELAAATSKTLPPRSKTPSGPVPSTTTVTTKVPLKSAPGPGSSRPGSTMRNYPPAQSAGRTPTGTGTLRRNPFASSVASTASNKSPTKIPARVPLGGLRHGNNSPERRTLPEPSYDTSTIRKMGPPTRAPPPKMRDIFTQPAATPQSNYDEDDRCASVASSATGSVRHIAPEDVYDDRERSAYMTSTLHSHDTTPQTYRDLQVSKSHYNTTTIRFPPHDTRYHPETDSRQPSTTSTTTGTQVSGSENWETYDDASEPERDASEAYYAKLRATRGKRATPEGGYTPPGRPAMGKKIRGMIGGAERAAVVGEERVVSDSAWTDEDAF